MTSNKTRSGIGRRRSGTGGSPTSTKICLGNIAGHEKGIPVPKKLSCRGYLSRRCLTNKAKSRGKKAKTGIRFENGSCTDAPSETRTSRGIRIYFLLTGNP